MIWYWLRGRVHVTWFVTAFCGAFVMGVWSAQWIPTMNVLASLLLAAILMTISLGRKRRFLLVAIVGAGILVGLVRGVNDHRYVNLYASLVGAHVRVSGTLSDDVSEGVRGSTVGKIGQLHIDGRDTPGEMWVSIATPTEVRRGDRVVLDGKMSEGFGHFSASIKNATLLSASRVENNDPALDLRDRFSQSVHRAVKDPEASLGVGFLLGQKQALPQKVQEALTIAGLTHIVVASGYNLTIIVRFARRIFEKYSRYATVAVSLALVAGFVAVTGLGSSMARAGLVALLSIIAWCFGRRFHPVTLLAVVAAVTVLFKPAFVWGDVGWALSFAAFAGVMILAPLLTAFFYGDQQPPAVARLLFETLSAQLLTLPIIMSLFGTISIIAVVGNILVLPFVPAAMLLTFIAGIGEYLGVPAAIVGWPAEQLLRVMISVIEWCASVPGAQAQGTISVYGFLATYGVVGIVMVILSKITHYQLRESSIVE